MGGNVFELNEAIIFDSSRGVRGGFFLSDGANLRAAERSGLDPSNETYFIGFRVSQVPGPGSVALLAFGGLAAARRRR